MSKLSLASPITPGSVTLSGSARYWSDFLNYVELASADAAAGRSVNREVWNYLTMCAIRAQRSLRHQIEAEKQLKQEQTS